MGSQLWVGLTGPVQIGKEKGFNDFFVHCPMNAEIEIKSRKLLGVS
jgi:hypothetical protein